MSKTALSSGLYLVATPIGTANDITLRALEILASADIIAAEDTRNTRRLMDIHGIKLDGRDIIPYHDHNGAAQRPKIIEAISEGKSVAYVSDAGTPMVADPGYTLSRAIIDAGLPVTAAPGASALLAALSVSGMPTDRFMFAGFPPPKSGARLTFLKELRDIPSTLVFFESPKRLDKTLAAMLDVFGGDRPIALCRELTKKFEQVLRGKLSELASADSDAFVRKGELVIVIGPPLPKEVEEADIDSALREALEDMSVKDAAAEVAQRLGVPRKQAYGRALQLVRT